METKTIYTGNGITVVLTDRGYTENRHNLLDADVVGVRTLALAEIDGQILALAPGSVRAKDLARARTAIEAIRSRAEIAAEEQAQIMADMDRARENSARGVSEYAPSGIIRVEPHRIVMRGSDIQLAYHPAAYAQAVADWPAEQARREAEDRSDQARREAEDAARKAREAEKQATKDSARAEALAWIEAQGSVRVRGLAAADIDGWERVYRAERLAAERPGWVYLREVCGETESPHADSVMAEHLAALAAARTLMPDAKLAWLGDGAHMDDCDCDEDEYDEKTVSGRIVIAAEFLGGEAILEIAG